MPSAPLLPDATVIDGDAHAPAGAAGEQDGSGPDDPADQLEALIETMQLDQDVAMQYFDIKIAAGWENDPALVTRAVQMVKDMSKVGNVCVAKLMAIVVKVAGMGVDMNTFNRYAFAKYGKAFTSKPDVLAKIEAEVDQFLDRPRDEVMSIIADALAPV